MLQAHLEDNLNLDNEPEIYEPMSNSSQDIMMKYSGCSEDIYESMLGINPECAEDLCKISYRITPPSTYKTHIDTRKHLLQMK